MKENIKIFLRDEDIVKEEETSIKEDEVPTEDKDNKKSNETRPTKNAKKSEKNENSEIKMTQEEYSEYLELKNAVKQKDNIISNLNGQIKKMELNLDNINQYVETEKKEKQILVKTNELTNYTNNLYDEKPYLKESVQKYVSKKNIEDIEIKDIEDYVESIDDALKESSTNKKFINKGVAISNITNTTNKVSNVNDNKSDKIVDKFFRDLGLKKIKK
jgi:hypothetical protein